MLSERSPSNLKIAKSLAQKLPQEKDKCIAYKWINKLAVSYDAKHDENLLKQLIMILQRNTLADPWIKSPDSTTDFDEIRKSLRSQNISELIDEAKYRLFDPQPYITEHSGDMKEYVAYQEIPKFGQQFYYACSSAPIYEWDNPEKAIFPKNSNPSNCMLIPKHYERELFEKFQSNKISNSETVEKQKKIVMDKSTETIINPKNQNQQNFCFNKNKKKNNEALLDFCTMQENLNDELKETLFCQKPNTNALRQNLFNRRSFTETIDSMDLTNTLGATGQISFKKPNSLLDKYTDDINALANKMNFCRGLNQKHAEDISKIKSKTVDQLNSIGGSKTDQKALTSTPVPQEFSNLSSDLSEYAGKSEGRLLKPLYQGSRLQGIPVSSFRKTDSKGHGIMPTYNRNFGIRLVYNVFNEFAPQFERGSQSSDCFFISLFRSPSQCDRSRATFISLSSAGVRQSYT